MLPREVIRKAKKLEIITRRLVNDRLAGQYHAVFKGQGMDFDEVRPYHEGDDVRFIDWNVSARTGDLHIKRFVEERELTVILAVDVSSSVNFGTAEETKRVIMAELAAVLAFSAIKNNDRVGLMIFSDHVEHYLPAKKGKKHVMRVITDILNHKTRGTRTDIGSALQYLSKVTKRKAVVFLISDFLAPSFEKGLKIAARRHDVVPIVVEDPLEQALPEPRSSVADRYTLGALAMALVFALVGMRLSGAGVLVTALVVFSLALALLLSLAQNKAGLGGLIGVKDLESDQRGWLDAGSPQTVASYAEQTHTAKTERDRLFNRLKLDTIAVQTNASYIDPLAAFFRRRARRH